MEAEYVSIFQFSIQEIHTAKLVFSSIKPALLYLHIRN